MPRKIKLFHIPNPNFDFFLPVLGDDLLLSFKKKICLLLSPPTSLQVGSLVFVEGDV